MLSNAHTHFMRKVVVLFSFYEEGNKGLVRLSNELLMSNS